MMRTTFRLILVVLLGLLSIGSAYSQGTVPPPNNPGPGVGVIAPLIFGIIGLAVENQANQPEPPPQTTEPTPAPPTGAPLATRVVPAPRLRPVFRDLPLPTERPLLSQGRPAVFDAEFEPQTIVLLFDVHQGEQIINDVAAEFGLIVLERDTVTLLGVSIVKFRLPPDQTVEQALSQLAGDPRIVGQQPNYVFNLAQQSIAPTDMRPLQYAPEKLRLTAAHATSLGEGVNVGIIDTAIDARHPEFALNPVEQSDVLGGQVVSRGHGTAMGGLIVASAALEGVAPGVHLISIRAFDATDNGSISSSSFALAKALDQMAASNADVVNMSFAGPRDPLILKVMDRLEELDLPVIAAAGNNGPDADPVYPAAHRHAIAVTATDSNDAGFVYANLGMYVEVAAPGVDILSPQPDERYDYETGTSAATAQITGIVALMLARNPNLSTAEIRMALTNASRDLGAPGRDEVFGAGLVDASLAVAAAEQFP